MNSPYLDLENALFYSEYAKNFNYDDPHKKDACKYCMCVCSDYPILKGSIRTHEKTTKHKKMLRMLK
jgi:hypothetical protein